MKSSIKKPLSYLSEAFSQQHRQLLAFLTALSSSSVSLLTHHQQHQLELLLSALRGIRCPPGSNIGALLGVALSSSYASLPLHHQQHQPEPLLSALCNNFLEQLSSTHLAGWRSLQSALSEGALWRCSRHQQQQWTAAAVVRSRSLLPGVDSHA